MRILDIGYTAIGPESGAHKSRFHQALIADVTQNQKTKNGM